MDFLFFDGKFLGITWNGWKFLGWAGNGIFFTRFIIQWIATEKNRRVVIPIAFWYCSLLGTFILLIYAAFYLKDSVMVGAYLFNWIPYTRNLYFAYKERALEKELT
jgi:lipid-A-disaccharide synthase-like uncharacterized protein